MNLVDIDKKLVWHPFTQEKTAKEIIYIERGEGAYIYDKDDKPYIDLISSWWVNIHGHAREEISQAIYEQANKLEQVIFAGFTHKPAIELCARLSNILPKKLQRYFFSDNGSTAVEVALKMAYQYWKNKGEIQRRYFISFDGGYHGDTVGAMSVGANSGFHDNFKDLFFKIISISYPETWQDDETIEKKEEKTLAELDKYIADYGNEIAAMILEPLVQGASGMRMCRVSFLKKLVEKIRSKGILVIFDEIMTGFYRTGSCFAFEQINFTPDFVCLSKALTGGFLPMSLTITSQEIYEAFLDDSFVKAFAHGHSYTANPLACSAAIASLNLLQTEDCQQNIVNINLLHNKALKWLKDELDIVHKIRLLGTIAAVDLLISREELDKLKYSFMEAGLLLRPLGTTLYLLPPYCIKEQDLMDSYAKIIDILKKFNQK